MSDDKKPTAANISSGKGAFLAEPSGILREVNREALRKDLDELDTLIEHV